MERKSKPIFINCPYETKAEAVARPIGNYQPKKDVSTGPIELNIDKERAESVSDNTGFSASVRSDDIFKAFIPWFLYKPPYGFPREVNVLQLRLFARNAYIFAVIKTLQDEVASIPYDVVLKEEYIDQGYTEDEEARKSILSFFQNPNGNDESFEHLLRCWTRDMCELDSGIGVKVFDRQGKFTQLFARDGGTFLKNPDIYGYMGDRVDFVPPPTQYVLTGGLPDNLHEKLMSASSPEEVDKIQQQVRSETYDAMYRNTAAYFQYGWTAGARPVPFGKREILYFMLNPRTDSIYGRSPIEVLYNQILTLVYGSEYNLDFYLNNNIPTGLLTFKGASKEQADAYRVQMENQFMTDDEFGNMKKKHFKVPITGFETTFTNLAMSSKDMEVIEQQKWFSRLVWAAFGVTADEMGFVENSNKAISQEQSKVVKRRAVKPIISAIQYMINNQLMPEFEHPEYEFKFIDYDIDEDIKKNSLWESQIRMGVRTSEEVRTKELGLEPLSEEEVMRETNAKHPEVMMKKEEFAQKEEKVSKKEDLQEKKPAQKEEKPKEKKEKSKKEEPKEEKKSKEEPKELKNYSFERKISLTDLEHDLKQDLDYLEKAVLEDVELQFDARGLHNIKGYVNVKAVFEDTLTKYSDFFNDGTYRKKIATFIAREMNLGVEEVENLLDRNLVISTTKVDDMIDYVTQNVKDMNTDLVDNLRKTITMGIFNREGIDSIKTRIKKVFNTTEDRAIAIARTESNRAFNMGANLAAQESGIKFKKKWIAHIDVRTSKVCRDLNDTVVDMNEKFKWEDQEFDFPPAHVNCRSRVLYIQED